ncbi:PAS domain-containing sensor histidine kinase [Leptospira perolatii]|uniref:histidine kinase n=1 Tax=Leptospira perolatii TaxID=2023191 RepID=A0A2M9ZPR7_9LEPT|nr:histidine kinase N-terminal 7TM domain-containing protein [Leptospira perolatii]PJZ70807.1 PAS domain-containing sensor histidine kinase [Leptospira perolatii]PJZ74015.1 PAS domain-containing sensor histidine kinase [Leptospira perolatii]
MQDSLFSNDWFRWTPYALLPIISFILSSLNTFIGFRNRHSSAAKEFLVFSFGMQLYSFGYFWEMVSLKDETIIFWDNFQFIGPDLFLATLPLFCLKAANLAHLVRPITIILSCVIPLATEITVWFGDPLWIRTSHRFDTTAPWKALIYQYGPMMNLFTWNYLLVFAVGVLILLVGAIRQKGYFRVQSFLFLFGLFIPFIGAILTVYGLVPFIHPKLDIFPLSATLACLVWMYGLFYFRLLDIIPIARDYVFEYMRDIVFVIDKDNLILDCNQSALRLLQIPKLQHRKKVNYYFPDLQSIVQSIITKNESSEDWKYAYGNSEDTFNVSVSAIGEAGSPFRLLTLRNVTDRVLLEKKTSEERDVLQSILNSTSVLFLVLDAKGKILHFNKACESVSGYSFSELKGRPFWETVLFPEDVDRVKRVFRDRFSHKRFPFRTYLKFRSKLGQAKFTTWDHTEIRDEHGNLDYVISTGADSTGLEEAAVRITTLQRVNKEILAKNTIIESQKRELEETLDNLKKTQAQMIQQSKLADLGQLAAGIAHEINNPIGAIQAAGHNIQSQLVRMRKNLRALLPLLSRLNDSQWNMFQELVEKGTTSREIFIGLERRKVLGMIKEEMSSLQIPAHEEMSEYFVDYGIASDWKKFLPLLRDDQARSLLPFFFDLIGPEQNVNTIRTAVDRSAKIIYALRSFAHYDSSPYPQKRPVSLKENIETVLTLYQNLFKHGVEVNVSFEKISSFMGYPDDLMHLWTNLITNAVQAMSHKGNLEISAQEINDEIRISFTDNGPGIPEDVQSKVFEIFFTTKPQGEGSGLGLDIARRIAEKHGGRIWFESMPGRTVFVVSLPIDLTPTVN